MSHEGTDALKVELDPGTVTRLRLLLGRFGRVLRQQLPQGDLAYPQVSLLLSVEKVESASAGDLAVAEGVSPPSITRSLKQLEAAGLVARTRDTVDGRIARVSLTARGRLECDWIRQRRDALLHARLALLTAEELNQLIDAIPIFERLLKAVDRKELNGDDPS